MSELLIELFCEEIPARMQAKAEEDLGKALDAALKAAGVAFTSLETASGPRRLSVVVQGLPARSKDVREEKKGPKVGAPDAAIQGFLRSAGLTSIDTGDDHRRRQEGRLLHRDPRNAGPRDGGHYCRGPAADHSRFQLAEIHAHRERRAALGAALAADCLRAGWQGRAVRDWRHSKRQCHRRPPRARARALHDWLRIRIMCRSSKAKAM